jgi:hypothetical protein
MCIALAVQTFAGIAAPLAPPVASDYIGEKPAAGWFPRVHQKEAADIFVGDDDWKVAQIAAADLTLDVERVTGRRPDQDHFIKAVDPYKDACASAYQSPELIKPQ